MAALREPMRAHAPDAQEVLAYGSLAWRGNKILVQAVALDAA